MQKVIIALIIVQFIALGALFQYTRTTLTTLIDTQTTLAQQQASTTESVARNAGSIKEIVDFLNSAIAQAQAQQNQ